MLKLSPSPFILQVLLRSAVLSLAKVRVLFISLMFSAQEQKPDFLAAHTIPILAAAVTVEMLASDVKVLSLNQQSRDTK